MDQRHFAFFTDQFITSFDKGGIEVGMEFMGGLIVVVDEGF